LTDWLLIDGKEGVKVRRKDAQKLDRREALKSPRRKLQTRKSAAFLAVCGLVQPLEFVVVSVNLLVVLPLLLIPPFQRQEQPSHLPSHFLSE
jgi:hypothetical protein